MQQASINLTESLHEVYEPDWHGKDDVMTIGKVSFLCPVFSHHLVPQCVFIETHLIYQLFFQCGTWPA